MSNTSATETEGTELLSGYSTKKVVASVALACVLHVVVLTGYIILGSSKKPKATAEAKPEEKGKTPDEKSKSPAPVNDEKLEKPPTTSQIDSKNPDKDSKPGDSKKSPEEKKNSEVAAPNEIPKSPDGDIEDIIKRK